MNLKGTKTEQNLMEAFAGESQARNRYTFAAGLAKKQKMPILCFQGKERRLCADRQHLRADSEQ